MKRGSVAAGGKKCPPAATIGGFLPALNFAVRPLVQFRALSGDPQLHR